MPIQSLSQEQLRALLTAAKLASTRDWLAILVAYSHGLRASEIVNLRRNDLRDGFLTVQRLKGSLKTTQELLEHADPLLNERAAMLDYAQRIPGHQRLFPISRTTFWRRMQAYAKVAGIPQHLARPHVLKHSIAMHTIKLAGIENVRQHLGHKSISSTGEYLKVSDSDASAAVQRALKLLKSPGSV